MDFWKIAGIVFLLCAMINLPFLLIELRKDKQKKQAEKKKPVQQMEPPKLPKQEEKKPQSEQTKQQEKQIPAQETPAAKEKTIESRGKGACENMKEMVKLHCKTCGHLNDEPLKVYNEDSFYGAEIAAYNGCIRWDNQIPTPGAKLVIRVESPFCCAVGGSFWAGYSDSQFVQGKLLSILSMDKYEAEIRMEVLDIKDRLAFVKPVSDEEKERMLETHTYEYCEPCGDAPNPQIIQDDPGILHFFNTWGGGDVNFDDYIYTDPDGIDHLFLKEHSDFEGAYSFVGDEILGFHADSPYHWENGLLIDWKSKTVIGCADGVTEVVIPQGIVRLGWFSFKSSSRLERITIPDSVTRIHNAFCESPKEVILTGNSQLTENDLLKIRSAQIHRIP